MSPTLSADRAVEAGPAASDPDSTRVPGHRRRAAWTARLLLVPRFLIGVLLCQTVLTTLLVVGWTQRWLQRRALAYLW